MVPGAADVAVPEPLTASQPGESETALYCNVPPPVFETVTTPTDATPCGSTKLCDSGEAESCGGAAASTFNVTGTTNGLSVPAGVIVTLPLSVPGIASPVVLIETGNAAGVEALAGG